MANGQISTAGVGGHRQNFTGGVGEVGDQLVVGAVGEGHRVLSVLV